MSPGISEAHEALIASMNSRSVRVAAAKITLNVATFDCVSVPTEGLSEPDTYAALALFALVALTVAAREIGLGVEETIAVLRDSTPFPELPL